MTKFIFTLLIFFFVACSQQPSPQNRDLIMNNYFLAMDSLPFADTSGEDFRLLMAYHRNDTGYLKKSYAEIAELLKYAPKMWKPIFFEDTIPINKKHFEEAYRFCYDAAFCPTTAIMTIGKRTDSIILDLCLYDSQDDMARKVKSHTIKQLTKQDWEELTKGIFYCDFWGLKEMESRSGFDGSSLYITGYKIGINGSKEKHKTIYRWAAEEMAIGQLFKRCLDWSDTTIACFHFYKK